MKECSRCHQTKDDAAFSFLTKKKTLKHYCKQCGAEMSREYRRKLKEGILQPPERTVPSVRTCKKCNIEKPIEEYYVDPLTKHIHLVCKDCYSKREWKNRKKKPLPDDSLSVLLSQGKKRCRQCGQIKFLQNFPLHRAVCFECKGITEEMLQKKAEIKQARSEGKHYCSICGKIRERSWCGCKLKGNSSGRNQFNQKQRQLFEQGQKECSKCKEIKNITAFLIRDKVKADKPSGYSAVCGNCYREKYDLTLYEIIRQRKDFQEYILSYLHDEHACEVCHETKHTSLFPGDKRYANVCLYCRKKSYYQRKSKKALIRLKRDSYFRMTNNIRKKLKDALSGRKSGSTRSYLGISAKEFKEYIASLFTEGMSWDNYGEWHLDHYVPVAYFKDKPDEMKVCWNYRNLRPLWAKENSDKGDTLPFDAEKHLQRIKDSL